MKYRCFLLLFILLKISTLSANSFNSQLNSTKDGPGAVLSHLVLNGTIVSKDGHSSVALLEDDRNRGTIILAIGDTIYNFKLIRILENYIVFQQDTETYQLFLGKSGIIKTLRKEGVGPFKEKINETETPLTLEDTVVEKEYSRSYLEKRILDEWQMILQQIEFSPYLVDGRTKGFKMIKVPEESILSEMGIQSNDIILKLNNEELKDISYLITLFDKFKKDNQGEMTIERGGKLIRYLYFLK
ncbi:MAG: hypothetical protein MUP98_09945 [Candidatus Aminicenantes bacterium]|nr:hypothetical protein [Candidatus Aminicenantes bacterium]